MFLTKSKKSPYYQVVFTVNGKRTTVSTRSSNRMEAKRFLKNFIPSNNVTVIHRSNLIDLLSFKNEYISFLKPTHSESYIKRSIFPAFKILIYYVGNIPLKYLSVKQLDKFISYTYAKSPSSAALYYRTLKAAFSKAIVWEYLTDNPLKKIKAPKVAKTYPVFISKSEFQEILDNTKEQYLKDIFTTAFYTGMRLGELVNMKWSWIDLQNDLIKVQCSESFTTKSKKERIIPISSNIKNMLVNRFPKILSINNQGYVFTRIKDVKLNENFISKKFKQSVRLAGLSEKVHFHTLRHSFASMLVQRGVSLNVVKELLGHQDLATTQIYSHLKKENLFIAINLL